MRRLISRNTLLLPLFLAGAYILADLVVDHQLGGGGYFEMAHLILGALVLLCTGLLAAVVANNRRREEAVSRKIRAELEVRVAERTVELERANEKLHAEIAERKRIEQALRISEETARTLMNASSESAVLTDTRGIVLAVNETAARSLGVAGEQMLGISLFEFFSSEVATTRRVYLERVLATGQPARFEDERAGRSFDIHIRPVCDEDGNIVRIAAFGRDITQRKAADAALRASEEKYRLLFQNMAEGFALYELLYDENGEAADWRVLEVNDAYSRHTGIVPSQIVGRRMSELFPAAVPKYLPQFAAVVETQVPLTFETFAEAVGRYQRVSTFPAGGNRFANTIEDIGERRRAEEELRSSEEKFAKVFQFSPDAIVIIKADGNTVFDVNPAFTRLLGYERPDVIGVATRQLELMVFPDTLRVIELFEAERQVSDLEAELITRSGKVATMLVSLIPITVSNEPCVLMIAHDITARKESEEALRAAQAELAIGIEARAALEERQRLARELHDSVSQALYGISLGINTALTLLDIDRAQVLDALQYARSLARGGLQEMRALIFELRPESLQNEGLVAALTKQADALRARHEVEVEVNVCEEPELPLPAKEALYRIAREAMQNAMKHAHATRLDLRLISAPPMLILEVCDNGAGFDAMRDYPGHLGLNSMRERAQGLGGVLEIISAQDCGTQIRVSIPISEAAM